MLSELRADQPFEAHRRRPAATTTARSCVPLDLPPGVLRDQSPTECKTVTPYP